MPTLVLNTTAQTQDTRIRKQVPVGNFSGDAALYLGAVSTSDQDRILIKFLDLVPPGGFVTVSSATLSLRSADAQASSRGVEVRKFSQPWGYTTTTWNNRDTATPWSVAGALGGAEVASTVIATGTAPTAAGNFILSGAGLIADCQAIMNGGANDGWLVNLLDDSTSWDGLYRRIVKSSNATPSNRPTLTIEYTVGTPVNWTINSPTVNSDAGTVTLTVTLDAPAPGGGFSGLVNTYDITAVAGVDYTAQVAVPFSISAGNTTGNIVIPILP